MNTRCSLDKSILTQANPCRPKHSTHLHLEGLSGVQQVGAAGAWARPAVQIHPHLRMRRTSL